MALPRASRMEDWLVDLTAKVAKSARRALARPDAGRVVAQGAYGVPTVTADQRAEQVILDELAEAPIPLHLFSEEIGHRHTKGARYTLVADPIDGTRNAVRNIPFYCVSLAVGRTCLNDIEVGVVRNATTGDVYRARRGQGSYREGTRLKVRPFSSKEVLIAAALDYERELKIHWQPHIHFRDLGSAALEMCLVASGALDLFLSTKAYLRIVDVAASTLVLREAGGQVLDLQKKPLNAGYDLTERISMVALGDRRAWRVLE